MRVPPERDDASSGCWPGDAITRPPIEVAGEDRLVLPADEEADEGRADERRRPARAPSPATRADRGPTSAPAT